MNTHTTPKTCIALIDIGNTRMKLGWIDPDSGAREPVALAVEHQHLEQVITWLAQQALHPVAAIGVNVAGPAKAAGITQLLRQAFDCPVRWLHSQRQTAGIHNSYGDPRQLGADRWFSMIGLAQVDTDPTQPRLLASFGTATTVDTLCPATLAHKHHGNSMADSANTPTVTWTYTGGLIIPGPALMRSSLAHNTAQLPEAEGPVVAFPVNTHQAITSGIAAAQAGAVVRQWQACLARYGVPPKVYGTGGGWPGVEQEVQSALALAQRLNQTPVQPACLLASPILDGLAQTAAIDRHAGLSADQDIDPGPRP